MERTDPGRPPAGDPLLYLLNQVDPRLSRDKQDELDDDPESLRKLLELKGERLTWEELRRIRQYTVNFNPAVEGEMGSLTEEEQPVDSTGAGPSDMSTSQAQAVGREDVENQRRIMGETKPPRAVATRSIETILNGLNRTLHGWHRPS